MHQSMFRLFNHTHCKQMHEIKHSAMLFPNTVIRMGHPVTFSICLYYRISQLFLQVCPARTDSMKWKHLLSRSDKLTELEV